MSSGTEVATAESPPGSDSASEVETESDLSRSRHTSRSEVSIVFPRTPPQSSPRQTQFYRRSISPYSAAGREHVRCPICMDTYNEIHYPVVSPGCGHSICKRCADLKNSNMCDLCRKENFRYNMGARARWLSKDWKKNYGLIEIARLYEKAQQELKNKVDAPSDIDYLSCSYCQIAEKRERLRICMTCAEKKNEDWKTATEEKLVPFVVCAFCCDEKHNGHRFERYLPWKLDQLLNTSSSVGKTTVTSMKELCLNEIHATSALVEKWNEKLELCRSTPCLSHREALATVSILEQETNLFKGEIQEFQVFFKNSMKRLDEHINDMNNDRIDQPIGSAEVDVEIIVPMKDDKVVPRTPIVVSTAGRLN